MNQPHSYLLRQEEYQLLEKMRSVRGVCWTQRLDVSTGSDRAGRQAAGRWQTPALHT